MRKLNKYDINFLNNLQHEMLTQDHVGQADPRFWVVMETVREWGYSSAYSDNYCIYDEEDNIYEGETLEDIFIQLVENEYDIKYKSEEDWIKIEGYKDTITTFDDICEYMESELGMGECNVCYYKDVEKIVPDTMFLTKRECEEHIKRNHYHYNKPHPYAMTAWRSPQVEKLYEILQNVVWEDRTEDIE